MAEHDYDEVQEIELDYTGYTIPFNRSNQILNEQQENSVVRKTTGKPGKQCVFLWIGIFVGSIVSGVTVFLVIKYGKVLSYDASSCLWTEWTEWAGCNLFRTSGTEKRVQIYTGHAHNCLQKEKFETRACEKNISYCFWTEWTVWTGCNSLLVTATEKRLQIYTGYDHNCQKIEKVETRACNDCTLDIRFDPTTLHSNCFLSEDHTILSNMYTDRTWYSPQAESRLKKYNGAMVNTCVEKSTSIYYEIYFQYVIPSDLKSSHLVLELGIGERNKIDNYHSVGISNVSGWSFQLANCLTYKRVCFYAEHVGVNKHIKPFSNNTAGTQVNGTFGILIDRVKHKFSLIYNNNVMFTFHDVLSNVSLCPVFGVYNINRVHVDLQIVSVGNMTYVP